MVVKDIAMETRTLSTQTEVLEGIVPFEEVRRRFLRKRRESSSSSGGGGEEDLAAPAPTVARLGAHEPAATVAQHLPDAEQVPAATVAQQMQADEPEPGAATQVGTIWVGLPPERELATAQTIQNGRQAYRLTLADGRPHAGTGTRYFEMLGNLSGRWGIVDGTYKKGGTTSGKLFTREIPRQGDDSAEYADKVTTHTKFWIRLFFEERKIHTCYEEPMPLSVISDIVDTKQLTPIPERALFYPLRHTRKPAPDVDVNTRYYFHGSYFQTMWQLTEEEEFMDSDWHGSEGQEASTKGLYVSDQFGYAMCYGWACQVFKDGLFYRCGFIVKADYSTKRHEKKKGSGRHEIVFPASSVQIIGLIILPDAEVPSGTPRFYDFNLSVESWPRLINLTPPRDVDVGSGVARPVWTKWDGQWR